ncbi:hypothetical protein NB723_003889 [Xanthomonas sacchari]|nr:hypothetical protein [Xanthomonas sacchari]
MRRPRHRAGRAGPAAVRLQRVPRAQEPDPRAGRVRAVPAGRGRRRLRRQPDRPGRQFPRPGRLRARLRRAVRLLQARPAAATDRHRRQAAGGVPDRRAQQRRARVPLGAGQRRRAHLHRCARRTRHRAAAAVRLRMDPRHPRDGGERAPFASEHPRYPVRGDHRRRSDHQGREQHRDRAGHLQRTGGGQDPVAGRCAVRFRAGRQPGPAQGAAVSRDAVARADLQHAQRPHRAQRRHRAGLRAAARGPRHHFSRRLLPAERRSQGVRRGDGRDAVQARDPLAQRRGRAVHLLRARGRQVRAVRLQHHPPRAAEPGVRPWLRVAAGRAHGAVPCRGQRADPDPSDAGLADSLQQRRVRRHAPAEQHLPRPHRQCRTGARHLQPVRAGARDRPRRGVGAALPVAGGGRAAPVRRAPLAGGRALRRPGRRAARHQRHRRGGAGRIRKGAVDPPAVRPGDGRGHGRAQGAAGAAAAGELEQHPGVRRTAQRHRRAARPSADHPRVPLHRHRCDRCDGRDAAAGPRHGRRRHRAFPRQRKRAGAVARAPGRAGRGGAGGGDRARAVRAGAGDAGDVGRSGPAVGIDGRAQGRRRHRAHPRGRGPVRSVCAAQPGARACRAAPQEPGFGRDRGPVRCAVRPVRPGDHQRAGAVHRSRARRRATVAADGATGGTGEPVRRARAVPRRHPQQARGTGRGVRDAQAGLARRPPAQGALLAGRGLAHPRRPAAAHRALRQRRRTQRLLRRRPADSQAARAGRAAARLPRQRQGRRRRGAAEGRARPGGARAARPQRAVRGRRQRGAAGSAAPLQRQHASIGPDPAAA